MWRRSERNTVQWVCLKVRQEALRGSELSVAEGIQVAGAIDQLISCLEGSCKWEHNHMIFKTTYTSESPASLPSKCTEGASPTDFCIHLSTYLFKSSDSRTYEAQSQYWALEVQT